MRVSEVHRILRVMGAGSTAGQEEVERGRCSVAACGSGGQERKERGEVVGECRVMVWWFFLAHRDTDWKRLSQTPKLIPLASRMRVCAKPSEIREFSTLLARKEVAQLFLALTLPMLCPRPPDVISGKHNNSSSRTSARDAKQTTVT